MMEGECEEIYYDVPKGEEGEYEETLLMVDQSTCVGPERSKAEESYIQILGLSTENPLVKINNQVYAGEYQNTLGSHLLLEIEDHPDTESITKHKAASKARMKKKVKSETITDKTLSLQPVHLEAKNDFNMSQKKRRLPSNVWSMFTLADNKQSVICNICNAKLAYHSSTHGMKMHAQAKHKQRWNEINATASKPAPTQQPLVTKARRRNKRKRDEINATASKTAPTQEPLVTEAKHRNIQYPADSPRQKLLTEKLFALIYKDLQPFRVVNEKAFREYTAALDPRFVIPSRQSISEKFPDVYEEVKKRVLEELALVPTVAITTDLWTSRDTKSYIGITAHFVNNDFKLKSYILATRHMPEDSTGANIGQVLYDICTEWGIFEKISAVVADCSSNMKCAIDSVGLSDKHVYCMGHLLNLCVQETLEQDTPVIERVRQIVKTIHLSPNNVERLNSLQQRGGAVAVKLIGDVSTRWNSCYAMMERYVRLHHFVTITLCLIGKPGLVISDNELDQIKHIVMCLEPFDKMTKEVSADQTPTLGKVFPIVKQLVAKAKSLPDSQFKERLVAQVTKRFNNIEDNQMITSATFLDPRFKTFAFSSPATTDRVKQNIIDEMQRTQGQQKGISDHQQQSVETTEASDTDDFWSSFDQRIQGVLAQPPVVDEIVEVNRFAQDMPVKRTEDPTDYWRIRSEYPKLKNLAQKYLGIPATSVPSERLFSKSGEVISDKRSSIKPSKVDKILFLNKNC